MNTTLNLCTYIKPTCTCFEHLYLLWTLVLNLNISTYFEHTCTYFEHICTFFEHTCILLWTLTFNRTLVVTQAAAVWFLTTVYKQVSVEIWLDLEGVLADIADKRRITRVCSYVYGQLVRTTTLVVANLTAELGEKIFNTGLRVMAQVLVKAHPHFSQKIH